MIAWDADGLSARWAADRIPDCAARGFGPCVAGAVIRHGRIAGMMVFHNWVPEHGVIDISAAAEDPRWLSRRADLFELMAYPFRHCQMVKAVTAPGTVAFRMAQKVGATIHEIPRLRGRDAAGVICTLTDDAWSRYAKAIGHV